MTAFKRGDRVLYSVAEQAALDGITERRASVERAIDSLRDAKVDPARHEAVDEFLALGQVPLLHGSTGRLGQPRGARGRQKLFSQTFMNKTAIRKIDTIETPEAEHSWALSDLRKTLAGGKRPMTTPDFRKVLQARGPVPGLVPVK